MATMYCGSAYQSDASGDLRRDWAEAMYGLVDGGGLVMARMAWHSMVDDEVVRRQVVAEAADIGCCDSLPKASE
jgi:hypothetical protein